MTEPRRPHEPLGRPREEGLEKGNRPSDRARGTPGQEGVRGRDIDPVGDADAVPDTPYVPARGTEPNASPKADAHEERRKAPRGTTTTRAPMRTVAWVVVAIVVIAAAVVLIGM